MNTDELIIGAGRILVAAAGSSLDNLDVPGIIAGTVPAGWTDLGHTTAAVTLTDAPNYVMAKSQQSARTLDVAVSEIETNITTTLRQVTADKLASFINGVNAGGTITPGGIGSVPKFAVALVGPGPQGGTTLLSAPRCVYTGERAIAFDVENYTEVAVTIEILDDETTGGYTIYTVTPTPGS